MRRRGRRACGRGVARPGRLTARATSRNSGCSRSGAASAVAPRASTDQMCVDREPGRAASRRSSRGVKQRGPQVDLGSLARPRRAPRCARGCTPASASKWSRVLEVAHLEVGGERRQRERARRVAAPGPCRRARRGRRRRRVPGRPVRPNAPWHSEIAGVELGVERQRAGVEPLERRARRRVGAGEVDEPLARCRCRAPRCRARRARGRGARPAADVEHPHARLEPERVDEEVDLLLVPFVNE